ncbi:MAG: hypothetical protein QGG34_14565 [SAR202 cluster bacterium]|nr:hypothetical protein [SAR202 cluster bacterium]MDP6301653.1 hypothetical protein [SAR202 cluster bacterium]MDP7104574.1 hypothetical protein [SAR202 cluster bacterium]MDP7223661.1 hypothetical protein [SAR202 cluster bacterium]
MADTLVRATFDITEDFLQDMVLDAPSLPLDFSTYRMLREGPLDNATMAEQGFPGSTEERFVEAGRIDGHMREFGIRLPRMSDDGSIFVVGSVVHLFDKPDSVSAWARDVFVADFESHVGKDVGRGQSLVSVDRLVPVGFFDDAVALKALHRSQRGLVSSTVIDFRLGRILGVAFIGVVGDHVRLEAATALGIALEKRIVSVVLGA